MLEKFEDRIAKWVAREHKSKEQQQLATGIFFFLTKFLYCFFFSSLPQTVLMSKGDKEVVMVVFNKTSDWKIVCMLLGAITKWLA